MPSLLKVFKRKWFARADANGEDPDYAALDGEQQDKIEAINRIVDTLREVLTLSGSLRYDVVDRKEFTATAGQTAFTMDNAYNTTHDLVEAYSAGLLILPSLCTKTSTTVVTLPAQTLGTKVVIVIRSPGRGTSQLGSTSNGQGASLVGIEDAGGLTSQTTVEGVIQEILGLISGAAGKSYLESLLVLSGYLLKSGGTMTGAIAMGSNKITGLAAGTAGSNDAARMADITGAALLSALSATLNATYLALVGGTMAGNIAMGGNKITGLGAGTAVGDAVNKAQLDAAIAASTASLSDPVGSFKNFGAAVQTGWLECDGSAVSRTTYAALFAYLGTSWGAGDGATTFNVPDLRGKTLIGAGTGTMPSVQTITVNAGGSGYTSAPTVTIAAPSSGVTATATAVISGGAVTKIIITNRGSGYTSAPTVTISGGGGTGATATASLALTARTLGGYVGEEAHFQTAAEVGRHTHKATRLAAYGAGANGALEGTNGTNDNGDTNTNIDGGDAFNVVQPSAVVRIGIKY